MSRLNEFCFWPARGPKTKTLPVPTELPKIQCAQLDGHYLKPTLLQCHHIQERGQGGTDDEDNLIVICLPCHTDVHSKVPFTRRFSHAELKGHRDALIELVSKGTLPADEAEDVVSRIVFDVSAGQSLPKQLSAAATEILLHAAKKGDRMGTIIVSSPLSGTMIYPGSCNDLFKRGDVRAEAKYKAALRELEDRGLIEHTSEDVRDVTHEGYLLADELLAQLSKPAE